MAAFGSTPRHPRVDERLALRSVRATAFPVFGAVCAAALALVLARTALADSTEIAGVISMEEAEVAAVSLIEDAMPNAPSVADRLAIIRERIQAQVEYPPLARLYDASGETLVRFEIDRSGSAQNVRVVRSSGDDQLDTSAVRAVQSAHPLPWVYGPLEVPVHFELTASR